MEAFKHLNNLITYKSVFVPVELIEQVVTAAYALGVVVCGGAFSEDYKQKVLYIA